MRSRCVDEIAVFPSGEDRIEPLAEVLGDIDTLIEDLEKERLVLLFVRNLVMSEAYNVIRTLDSFEARRVIYNAVNEHDSTVSGISKAVNLREDFVRETIEKIKKDLSTDYL